MATEAVSTTARTRLQPRDFLRAFGTVLLATLKAYFVVGILFCVLIVIATPLGKHLDPLTWNISQASSLVPYFSLASMVFGAFLVLPVIAGMTVATLAWPQCKIKLSIAFLIFGGLYGLLLHAIDYDIPYWFFIAGGALTICFYHLITPSKLNNKVFYACVGVAIFLTCLNMLDPWCRLAHEKYMQSHSKQTIEHDDEYYGHVTETSVHDILVENLNSPCSENASIECLIHETVKIRSNLQRPFVRSKSTYYLDDDNLSQMIVDLNDGTDARELLKVLSPDKPEARMRLLFTAGEYDQATTALYDLQKTEKIGDDYGAVWTLVQKDDLDKALEIATLTIDWKRTVRFDELQGIPYTCGGNPELYPRPIEILSEDFAKNGEYDKAYDAIKLIGKYWSQNFNGNSYWCSGLETSGAYYGSWATLIVASFKQGHFIRGTADIVKAEQAVLDRKNGGYIRAGVAETISRVIWNYDPPPIPRKDVSTLKWWRAQEVRTPCDEPPEKMPDEAKIACYVRILDRVRGYIDGPNHL